MRTTWIAPLLALALTIAPATAVASYHGGDGPAPAEAFTDIVDAFEEDRPADAESTYRQAFADDAEQAPHVSSAIEDGLEQAQQAEPGSAEYAWATQVAKKGVLAVSYHTALDAADAGNADEADDYVGVLATKFDAEDQLPDTKRAFADVDEDSLDEAAATFEDEYATLIAAKVYAETAETPELLEAGEPTIAAKEAGEALGYGLSLQGTLATTQGEDTAETFREELEELGEHALAEDEEATRAEASEVLDVLAEHAISQVPAEKLEARQAYLGALAEGDIDEAETVYEDAFAEHASSYAPDAHQRIQTALTEVRQADGPDRAVQHQILEKSILAIAWNVGFTELAEEETHEGLAYLAILADKFDDRSDPGELALALGHVAASQDPGNPRLDTFQQTATDALLDKVHEEIDEVFMNWDDEQTAREKAIEAVVYYHPIHGEVTATLSEEDAEHLLDELEGLYNATTAGDREEADHEAEEAREILQAFENAGQDVSELDQALGDIERTLNIITLEIEEYVEYRKQGNDAKAQEEIDESKAFISKALSILEDNRPAFEDADADEAEQLEGDMLAIQQRLQDEEDVETIPDLVDQATERLAAFETVDPEAPEVDVRLGEPEATDDGYLVPVRLVGVPEGGYTLQATVSYDETQVTVESVDVRAQVGAETIEPGELRFNAAATEAEAEPVVAEILLAAEEDAEPQLSVTVDTLTDGQGEPLRLGNVTGEQLQLASAADAGSQTTQDAPLPGLAAMLAASLLASLLLPRRH